MNASEVVKRFWSLMATNDFYSVGEVLSDDFILEWPQSNERIRGRLNFARVNTEYPANGDWRFHINSLVGKDTQVVSDVSVTDGIVIARAITFFTVMNDKISKMVEFWPESYKAHANRAHLVEKMEVGK